MQSSPSSSLVLKDRVALVTGAGAGIGRGIAVALAEAGARVVVTDIVAVAAVQVRDQLLASGLSAAAFTLDVSRIESFAAFLTQLESTVGEVTILVNNAAVGGGEAFEHVTPARFDQVFSVSARGAFFLAQAVLPAMKRRGKGRIINISSLIAARGAVGNPHYAGAKAAMLGFARSWAIELAPFGITVNTVMPALTATPMATEALGRQELEKRAGNVPAGRLGVPQDVANTVVFLCSDAASFISGQAISPNGGEFVGAL